MSDEVPEIPPATSDPKPEPEPGPPVKDPAAKVMDVVRESLADGAQAEDLVKIGLAIQEAVGESGSAKKLLPHLITEFRKAIVPIILALLAGAGAASGLNVYQQDATLREAREAAEQEVLRLEEIRDRLREEVRNYLGDEASWEDVHGAIKGDREAILDRVLADYAPASASPLGDDQAVQAAAPPRAWLEKVLEAEVENMAAQQAAPR